MFFFVLDFFLLHKYFEGSNTWNQYSKAIDKQLNHAESVSHGTMGTERHNTWHAPHLRIHVFVLLLEVIWTLLCFSENHQARFFSDQTPPPVPKKSLKRTLSLPAEALNPSYHDHTGIYNYENPLYMIAPFHGTLTLQEEEVQEEQHQGPSLHRVNFDTPDELLQRVFRSFQSHVQVSMGIQECYLQFLRNTLQNIESSIFLNEQEMEIAKTSQPNDFILCEEQWTKRDAFYLLRCSKIPGRLFSAKVRTSTLQLQTVTDLD